MPSPRVATPKDTAPGRLSHSPAAHLSETVPIPESKSLIFWPAFAKVGQGTSEFRSRPQVIRRPLADRARSLVPPADEPMWSLVKRQGGQAAGPSQQVLAEGQHPGEQETWSSLRRHSRTQRALEPVLPMPTTRTCLEGPSLEGDVGMGRGSSAVVSGHITCR